MDAILDARRDEKNDAKRDEKLDTKKDGKSNTYFGCNKGYERGCKSQS